MVILEAMFDGTVFHSEELLALEPNTRVRITIEMMPTQDKTSSFLQIARSLNLLVSLLCWLVLVYQGVQRTPARAECAIAAVDVVDTAGDVAGCRRC